MTQVQFRKLNAIKDDVKVSAIRGGKVLHLNIKELVIVVLALFLVL